MFAGLAPGSAGQRQNSEECVLPPRSRSDSHHQHRLQGRLAPVEKLTNLGLDIFQFHVDDVPSANIAAYFPAVAAYLAKALSEGGLVMVNCLVGFSRSATVLTAALMINNHWSLARSLKKLRQSRPVKPNLGFMVQLLNLEQKLKNKGDRLI